MPDELDEVRHAHPPIPGPRELFRLLFVDEAPDERRTAADRVALEGSILDVVLGDARSLNRRLSKPDSRKLDEYLASVRDVETKLSLDKKWQDIPKPRTRTKEPENQGMVRDLPVLYDLIALALETDSTRVATLEVGGSFATSDLGIPRGYHNLSHHGQRPETIDLLVQVELYQVQQLAALPGEAAVDPRAGRRRDAARPHDGLDGQRDGQCQLPHQHRPADHPGRRRLPPW